MQTKTLLDSGRHVVDVDGVKLSYFVMGQGPLLVWHPGGPGMAIQGYPNYEVIASAFKVVFLDPRGVGQSERIVEIPADTDVSDFSKLDIPGAEAYALENYSKDILGLMNLWGVDSINLAGHSHGGFVALDFATRYPDKVKRLVVVGSSGEFDTTDKRVEERRAPKLETHAYKKYLALFEEKTKQGLTPLEWYKYGLALQLTVDIHDFEKHESAVVHDILEADDSVFSFVPAFYFETQDVLHYDMREKYKDIQADVLFIQGRQELLFLPEYVERAVASIPSAQVAWLEECAHMPMTEQPEALMNALTRFIRD